MTRGAATGGRGILIDFDWLVPLTYYRFINRSIAPEYD